MRSLLRLLLVCAVLVLAAALIAACGAQPAPAAPTQAPAPTQATAPQAVAPQAVIPQATQPVANPSTAAAAAVGSDKQWSQDPAPSLSKNPAAANTHHYQGDPNAPVVLIEASDFQ
jgi:hypothetical protein